MFWKMLQSMLKKTFLFCAILKTIDDSKLRKISLPSKSKYLSVTQDYSKNYMFAFMGYYLFFSVIIALESIGAC